LEANGKEGKFALPVPAIDLISDNPLRSREVPRRHESPPTISSSGMFLVIAQDVVRVVRWKHQYESSIARVIRSAAK